jgi:hypothetical protein
MFILGDWEFFLFGFFFCGKLLGFLDIGCFFEVWLRSFNVFVNFCFVVNRRFGSDGTGCVGQSGVSNSLRLF